VVVLSLVRSAFASPVDNCVVPSDPDILGLGVRLGIYFQIASNIFIGLVHPKEAAGSLPITNIFMTGVFIALVHSIVNNGYTPGSMICELWLVVLDLPLLGPIFAMAAVTARSNLEARVKSELSRPGVEQGRDRSADEARIRLEIDATPSAIETEVQVALEDTRDSRLARGVDRFTERVRIRKEFEANIQAEVNTRLQSEREERIRSQLRKIGKGEEVEISLTSATITICRWIAFTVLNTWFWFHGLSVQNDAQCQEPRVFFFANLSAYGHISTWFKVETVTSCLVSFYIVQFGLQFAWDIISDKKIRKELKRQKYKKKLSDMGELDFVFTVFSAVVILAWSVYGGIVINIILLPVRPMIFKAESSSVSRARRVVAGLFSCIGLALFILPLELAITWNKLDGVGTVSTSGQLLALTIGAFALFRVGWLVVINDEEDEESPDDLESAEGNPNNDTNVTPSNPPNAGSETKGDNVTSHVPAKGREDIIEEEQV
jgi:hypothetical protein